MNPHSGESRRPQTLLDSGFRRNDEKVKPPKLQRYRLSMEDLIMDIGAPLIAGYEAAGANRVTVALPPDAGPNVLDELERLAEKVIG